MQLILTLLINLVPAASVVAFGWSAFTLLLLYWLENIVVGAINVLKIAAAAVSTGGDFIKISIFIIPFFIFHYGMFCGIHAIFLWGLFGDAAARAQDADLLSLPWLVIERMKTDSFLAYNLALIAAYHVFNFLIFWVGQQRWKDSEPFSQMFEPYPRVIVVHLTILIAGMPVALIGQPLIAVFVLALLKTGLELGVMGFSGEFEQARAQLAQKAREEYRARTKKT